MEGEGGEKMNLFQKLAILSALLLTLFFSGGAFSNSGAQSTWDFCVAGDLTSTTVRDKMKAYDCKVHVLTGDYYGKEDTFVGQFKEKGVPVLAACGNHDDCAEVAAQDNINGERTNYGIKMKNVGFIIVNTENKIAKQTEEVNRLMSKFQNDPTIKFIVAAQHKNAVTNNGAHHGEAEVTSDREMYSKMADLYPKFEALFQGHNHNWLKCEPTDPDITVITEGTGGRTPYPIGSGNDDGDNCTGGISGSKYNGYTIVTVGDTLTYKHINIK
jgi:hypothetical protein